MLKSRLPATELYGITEQRVINETFYYARKEKEKTGRAPSKLLKQLNRVNNYFLFNDVLSHIGRSFRFSDVDLYKLWQRHGLEWPGLTRPKNNWEIAIKHDGNNVFTSRGFWRETDKT
jgi:hypothetical protein